MDPTNDERLEFQGKLYKVGDIVNVGYGVRVNYKDNIPKEKKKTTYRQDEIQPNGDDEDDNMDYNECEGDACEFDDDDYINQIEDKDKDNVKATPKKVKQTGNKKGYIDIDDFKLTETKLNQFLPLWMEELGIFNKNEYIEQLVPISYKEKLRDATIEYKHYEKYIVVKNSFGKLELQPYYIPGEMGIIAQDYTKLPYMSTYERKQIKIPKPPTNYKGDLKFGDCIKCTINFTKHVKAKIVKISGKSINVESTDGVIYKNLKASTSIQNLSIPKGKLSLNKKVEFDVISTTKNIEGKIVNFTATEFQVLQTGTTYKVKFDEKSIVKVDCPKNKITVKSSIKDEKQEEPEEYLPKKITKSVRKSVKDLFFSVLSLEVMKEDIFISKHLTRKDIKIKMRAPKNASINDTKELTKLYDKIDWDMEQRGIKMMGEYYMDNFRDWMWERYRPSIIQQAPIGDITRSANELKLQMDQPYYLLDQISETFGKNVFIGNGLRILNNMERIEKSHNYNPTHIAAFFKREFAVNAMESMLEISESELRGNLKVLTDEKLAIVIKNIIVKYKKQNPVIIKDIKDRMINDWALNEFNGIQPSDLDRHEFDINVLESLKISHAKFTQKYQKNRDLIDKYNEERAKLLKKYDDDKIDLDDILTKKGVKLYKDVKLLESLIYKSLSTKTIFSYLKQVFEILIFLSVGSPVGTFSKFFRAKVAAGIYEVSNLMDATISHKFPEFVMNETLSDKQFKKGINKLNYEIYTSMIDFIRVNVLNQQISSFNGGYAYLTDGRWDTWGSYIKNISKRCGERIKYPAKLTGDPNDTKDYKKTVEGDYNVYNAERELIPEDDAILCTDKSGKLTCSSLVEVLIALTELENGVKNPINAVTKTQYDQIFLKRMKKRYGHMIKGSKLPNRVLSFKVKK